MKLQLALDTVNIHEALEILQQVHDVIDIVEVGTPMIIREGVSAVAKIRETYPDLSITADLKIIDGDGFEANLALDAGADIVTVIGAFDDATISSCVEATHSRGKKTLADMICVTNIEERAREVEALDVDYICVHTRAEVKVTGEDPLHELQLLKPMVRKAQLAVAGGVKLENVGKIVAAKPDIVIVGGGIVDQANKREAALNIKKFIESNT